MNMTYELNNVRKDSAFDGKFGKSSVVAEVFSAMVNGKDLSAFGAKADKAVEYIKSLGEKAELGDPSAIVELNTLRRFVIEAPVMEEIKALSIFGSYQAIGFDETIQREVTTFAGDRARMQASNGDVTFPIINREVYDVPTFTVSGGYAVDYRRVALGDMSKENEGMAQVKTAIMNKATLAVVTKVYNAIKNATGVKYQFEGSGLTKAGVDSVLKDVRRIGKPTVIADYALLSQFTPWAGFVGSVNSNTITGISDDIMNELAANGLLGMYNGAILAEMQNPYDYYSLNAAGDNFNTLLPAGLGFVVPAGAKSPIATWTRGGLTSLTGNNIHTGKVETRFDLEVGVDVAKGHEFEIGTIYDTAVGGLE